MDTTVNTWDSWPEPLMERIRALHGEPVAVDSLAGMSIASVWRVRCVRSSAIVKSSPRSRETNFYRRVAARLREVGVPIVRADFSDTLGDRSWLLLEDVGAGSPIDVLDGRMIDALAMLHLRTRDLVLDLEPLSLGWTDAVTDAALGQLPPSVARGVAPAVRAAQAGTGEASARTWCWISGDANPTNWGQREDGTIALFDWELVRRGLPAHDLTTLVPGLGDPATFLCLAERYRTTCRDAGVELPWTSDTLASQLALAKLETVVQLLAAGAREEARVPAALVRRLAEALPPWLATAMPPSPPRSPI